MLISKNSYLVTSDVFTGGSGGFLTQGTNINFSFIEQIQNQYIQGIEAYNNTILAYDPSGNPVITQAMVAALTLTIYEGSNQVLFNYPVGALIAQGNGGIVREFADIKLNMTQSVLTVNSSGIVAVNYVAAFNVSYWRVPFFTRFEKLIEEDNKLRGSTKV